MAEHTSEKIISAETADRLISAHDGDMALLCIYLARNPGASSEQAAFSLCRTLGEIESAREKLRRLAAPAAIPPEDEPVEYPAEEIADSARSKAFGSLVDELAVILGATPSRAYLNVLMDMYDHLGLPCEVIMLLLHYCADECRRRWGDSRRPTARAISQEAYRWVNSEIVTLEQADAYIRRAEERCGARGRLAEMLGIRGRSPSQTEERYLDSWIAAGFDDELIAAAYDRTVTNTGSLKWPYMNRILQSWQEKGLHNINEVEEAEGGAKRRAASRTAPTEPDGDDFDRTWVRMMGDRK